MHLPDCLLMLATFAVGVTGFTTLGDLRIYLLGGEPRLLVGSVTEANVELLLLDWW